jgi:hypothetical protein
VTGAFQKIGEKIPGTSAYQETHPHQGGGGVGGAYEKVKEAIPGESAGLYVSARAMRCRPADLLTVMFALFGKGMDDNYTSEVSACSSGMVIDAFV